MKSYTPAARLIRIIGHLIATRIESQALNLQTQETHNHTLQREAAWVTHQLNEMILHIENIVTTAGPLTKYAARKFKEVKNLIALLFLASSLWANMGGISCTSDSQCGHWNYGSFMSCGSRTYCGAGVLYSCNSGTYYCALDCVNGLCNNWSSSCDGTCTPMPGMCEPSDCGPEVCTATGPCGASCGDGTCDASEDSTSCPADCSAATPPPPPGPSVPPSPGPSVPPPPPPPPANPCGIVGTICGSVTAMETPVALKGVPIELRDSRGKVIQTKLSTMGGFSFITGPGNYYLSPAMDRNQSASPSQALVMLPSGGSASASFRVRGIPAALAVTNAPAGTFILITTGPYTGAGSTPPPTMSAHQGLQLFSVVSNGSAARLSVPAGLPGYYVTCWKPTAYHTLGSMLIPAPLPSTTQSVTCL